MIQLESIESFLCSFFTWAYINLAIFTVLAYDIRKSWSVSSYTYLTKIIVITVDREVSSKIKTYKDI